MEFFQKVMSQIEDFVRGMSPQKKVAVSFVAIGIFAVVGGMFYWASRQSYTPLMTNLNAEDSSLVIRYLKEKNIPFRVEQGGRTIEIAPEFVDQLRMELAISGLPQTSVVGYEVFDKNMIGQTSFVQKINKKRALEGELMRTINAIHGVRRSRVHLAMPEKSTFVDDQKKSTASVFLDLEPGIQLNEKQVYGIGNLVARAVEGMDPSEVTIMDSMGKMISKNSSDSLSQLSSTQIEFKNKFETDLEKRVEDMLSRVVGDGKVVARISADLDFSTSNETKTTYDADGSAVRSQNKNTQSTEGSKPMASGTPGAQSNTPLGATGPQSVKVNDTKISSDTVNYEVPSTVVHTSRAPGAVKKLSVAIVVDGKTIKVKNADGVLESKVEPWPAEKVKEFEAVVASAVGLDRKRGDTLEIKNMEFSITDFTDAEAFLAAQEKKATLQQLALYAVVALIILLFFAFVVRPFIRWVTDNTTEGVETFLPQTLEELEKMQKSTGGIPGLEDAMPAMPDQLDPDKIESEMVKEKVISLVDSNPQKAALILKDWLVAEKPEEKGDAKNAV